MPRINFSRQGTLAFALLFGVLTVNAVGLWPELSISRVDLNDNVLHFALVERMVQAVERGENPLDCWSPEWTLGYPVLRTYQPLAHAVVVLAYFALGKSAGLLTVFVWVRFVLVALLPLSFFVAARLMGLGPLTAAAAALLAPLISTNFLYGVEYGSFTWAGSGLFPQALGSHLLILTLGLAFRAVKRGNHLAVAGALLGLTFLAHLIYGYMGAISVCLLALIPDVETSRIIRIRRVAVLGAAALLLCAFQLVPLMLDGAQINHSRWEWAWKWDSFGAGQALKWLVTGQLLDFGRLPVLTVLAFSSAALFAWNSGWNRRKDHSTRAAHMFILTGAAFWTLLFFGRDFWGPLLSLLGIPRDMQLHRVIGGAHIFLLLLAAIALSALWSELAKRWQYTAAIAATIVLLYAPVRERARNLSNDASWGARNLTAHSAERDSVESAIAMLKQRGGRAYAGLAAGWGAAFKVGEVPFYAFLSTAQVPAVAFLYHSMALTSDIMVRFNEANAAHYRLFNIHTVVAPADAPVRHLPFLAPVGQMGRFQILAAPASSYFDLVDVIASVKTTKNNFYEINDRWLQSDWVAKRIHLRLDWRDGLSPPLMHVEATAGLMAMPELPSPGEVRAEARKGDVYSAQLHAARPCYALFKMTWHNNWKAYVDGRPEPTVMLSPGFVGVPISAGQHSILLRYQPETWRAALGFAGLAGVLLLIGMEERNRLFRWPTGSWLAGWRPPVHVRQRLLTAAGLLLLALPVCIPLLTGRVLWGHDAFGYFPRLVEVHQNMTHGAFIPRWAPDLGNGAGQPLFLFHPPMIYYFGEAWHLLGFDFVTAMNLACAVVVLLSAVAMYLLARLYFGDTGGWLGAAAYLYTPYFAVDLYVRSSMEEFAAFPFFAFTLYGFGAYAEYRSRRYLLTGVAAYACVLFCHFPAALLFTPLLLGFLAWTSWMRKSWNLLWRQATGFVLGLGLSAFVWVPALAARQYVHMERATQGSLLFSNNLVYLHQLFYSPWGYGYSTQGVTDGMSFALGWSHLFLIAAAWIWTARNRTPNRQQGAGQVTRFFGGAALILCVLMLEDALWFWQQLPLLQNVQLPWRLLGPVALCMAMLIAPLGPILAAVPRWRTLGMAVVLALLIVPNLSHLHPGRFADVDPYFWTPQQLSMRGFETTTKGEVTPRWIDTAQPYIPPAARVISGKAEIQRLGRSPLGWSSVVKANAPSTLEMQIAWFPGWKVRVDGHPVQAGPELPRGLIVFQIPAGQHFVQVEYRRTATEKVAAGISLVSLILAAALGCGGRSSRTTAL